MNKLKAFLREHRDQALVGMAVVVVILILVIAVILGGSGMSGAQMGGASSSTVSSQSRDGSRFSHQSQSPQRAFVDVEGAVKKPGVYQFSNNMRIVDAINLAGGMERTADRKRLNLAQKLSDQQVVYVPVKGEKHVPTSNVTSGSSSVDDDHSSSSSESNGKININQADQAKLKTIKGIGDKRAAKIIDYRKSHGDFKQISDVKKISGIGQKFFDNIKGQITV